MRYARTFGRSALAALLSVSLLIGSIAPTATHTPKVFETIQDHLEMIAEHGHSHGFEEDILWALHGHSHDVADHDHNPAVLVMPDLAGLSFEEGDTWRGYRAMDAPNRIFRIERPPRA